MRWRTVAVQWVTVGVLLAILVIIQIYHPEWTGIDMGRTPTSGNNYYAIDGDSFKAGNTEIRLYGIDAPEYRQTCSDKSNPQLCGRMALDALSKLIRNKNINCKIIDHDRYGRQVSVCKDVALDINREMVRLGWAVAYRKHALAYVNAEREAKTAKRGIWAWSFEMPEDYRARNRVVQGGISSNED
jgi:endonuclease YncB( thermonuclease family)